jgi:hypothetical protein
LDQGYCQVIGSFIASVLMLNNNPKAILKLTHVVEVLRSLCKLHVFLFSIRSYVIS